jgi:hypothetical protein
MRENKLVNYLVTFKTYNLPTADITIGEHTSHKSIQEEYRWGGIPPLIDFFTTQE